MTRQVKHMLEELTGEAAEVPPRMNCALVGSEEVIAHYLEGEMREAQGETRGCLGWPSHRMKKVRGHLKGLLSSLEASRKKWCSEENALEARRKQLTEEMVEKLLKCEHRRSAFEARMKEAKARNRRSLDEGSFEGPIVPIGLKAPEAPKQKASDEAKAGKVAVLHLLDEEPEGVPKVSEGGSSGSGEVGAPPPEAPKVSEGGSSGSGEVGADKAEEEPQEQPPEAPASKAEEVKQRIVEAPVRLEPAAYVALEEEFIAVAKSEDLRVQDRERYEEVRGSPLGVCARCRWLSGCQSCDEAKAWAWACRMTLWHTAGEAVRPKAKPRGRPKAKPKAA